jgi:hypothetical protein
VLADIVGELARIKACYNLDKASDGVQDHLVMWGDQMSQAERQDWEQTQNDLKEGMESLGCPSFTGN